MESKFNREKISKEEEEQLKEATMWFAERMDEADKMDAEAIWEAWDAMVEWLNQPQEEESIQEEHPIIFIISKIFQDIKEEIYKGELQACAAGVSENFPESQKLNKELFNGEDVSLTFKQSGDTIIIGLVSDSIDSKEKVNLVFTFHDNSKETFYGKNIAGGGCWELKTDGRFIQSFEVIVNNE